MGGVTNMRVHITDVMDGDVLTEDVFNLHGVPVLSKGTVLGKKEIARLLQHHVSYVKVARIQPEPEEEVPPVVSKLQPVYQETVRSCEALFKDAYENGYIKEQDVDESFRPLAEQCRSELDVVQLLLTLRDPGEYTYRHSVQVGILCHYIAGWLGWDQEDTYRAGKAGFLHDIGKCRIPVEILNKPDKLTEAEFEIIKKHPQYGHEIIEASFPDHLSALGALQHHERVDGGGYPYGLKGDQIHVIGKIVAVADVYSAMISTRVYRQKRDLFDVLKELYQLSFNGLDPHVTLTFLRRMLPNFIGKKAELTSGEIGEIVMIHPVDLFNPLVKVGDRFIDLSQRRDLNIVRVYM